MTLTAEQKNCDLCNEYFVEQLNQKFKSMGTLINTIVMCTYSRPGGPPCRMKFPLDDDDEETYQKFGKNLFPLAPFSFHCDLHEDAVKIEGDLARIYLQEAGTVVEDGNDALNRIHDLSYGNKKFKKILREIYYYAPILAGRRLKRRN